MKALLQVLKCRFSLFGECLKGNLFSQVLISAQLVWRLEKQPEAVPVGQKRLCAPKGWEGRALRDALSFAKLHPGPSNSESPQDAFDDPKVPDLTGDPALLHLRVPHWPGEERSKD